jgi:DNA invertase Pin-like site-specific DNA recombinase
MAAIDRRQTTAMTTAIYARFSSSLQTDVSIEDQIRSGQALAARHALGPCEIYTDAALSGASMANRPGLLALLAAVEAGRITTIITEALDRLSRDQADTALIYRACATRGARILTVSDGEIGDDAAGMMQVGLRGVMNAMFLKDLAVKTHRGLAGVVASGRHAGPPPYGYRLRCGGAPGELEIDPVTSAVVARIWQDYADGLSPKQIAHALNAEGVNGPRGGPWRNSTIFGQPRRGNGILQNPLYRGTRVWNRNRKVKDPATGKARMVARPESEWISVPAPELAFIGGALAEAVTARLAGTAINRQPQTARRPKRPLSGLMTCGACGGSMVLEGSGDYRYYACSARRETGLCADRTRIRADQAEQRVLAALKARLMSPAAVRLAVETYRQARARLARQEGQSRAALERRITDGRAAISRLVTAIETGSAPASVMARLQKLESDVGDWEAERDALAPPVVTELHPQAGRRYAQQIEALQDAVTDPAVMTPAERARAIEAIQSLIVRITAATNEKSGEVALTVEGDLAALIHKTEAPDRGLPLTVGAGARALHKRKRADVCFAA